jgi:2-polyprenyl-6-methoxyphenol hydroxylase-like FAD-dependent oxidoreductase
LRYNLVIDRFDVIVVGARCAGSPLAMLLARAGLQVCLVDRARFPSETPSTHGVQPSGVRILDRLGVLDALLKVAPPIERGIVQFDDIRIEVDGLTPRVGAPMVNVRRVTLDAILLEAAAAAGAEVRTGTAVTGLVEEGGRIAGVRTATDELRAPLVVGADGARSSVARLVGAREYHRTPPGRVFLWAYLEGVATGNDGVWLGKLGDHAFLASPTDNGLFMAAVVVSIDRRHDLRGDREDGFERGLAHWPELHASLAGARRSGPVRMMSRWHGFFRESAGPGWALVGDAGHFKDPTPGQGISDALRQAVELAGAIERGLGGAVSADRALRDWWSWRDRDAWEMYWFAHDMGAPGPTPLLIQEIQRRAAADPRLIDGLLGVLNHDVAPSEVFTPALAVKAASTALRRNRGRRRTVLREARALVGNEVRRTALRRTRA